VCVYIYIYFFFPEGKVTKFDKVVKREICQITTKGTRIFTVIDGDASSAENHYLFALTEKVHLFLLEQGKGGKLGASELCC
jgi:hypothetical protein